MDWVFISCIVFGSIVMVVKKSRLPERCEDKHARDVSVTKERIFSSLVHFDDNLSKVAKALEMTETEIDDILNDRRDVTSGEISLIRENFEDNVKDCDPVTGLDNRFTFLTQMAKLEKNSTPFTLVFLDLNKFKPINDTYGHLAGDRVLERIARRLEANYAHVAAISRLGGDEFCMMFFDYQKSDVQDLVPEIKAIISEGMFFDEVGEVLSVGCAAACAAYPEDGASGKEILSKADEWMYLDKDSKNR